MAPTLSFRIIDFTLADTGHLAVPPPECPMAFAPGGSEAAASNYGFRPGLFLTNRSNHDFKRRGCVVAAPRGQRRHLRRGDCR